MTDIKRLQDFLKLVDTDLLIDKAYDVYNSLVAVQNAAADALVEVGNKLDEVSDVVIGFTGTQQRSVWEEAADTVEPEPEPAADDFEYLADFVAENHPDARVAEGWRRSGSFRVAFYDAIDTGSLTDAWILKLSQRYQEARSGESTLS